MIVAIQVLLVVFFVLSFFYQVVIATDKSGLNASNFFVVDLDDTDKTTLGTLILMMCITSGFIYLACTFPLVAVVATVSLKILGILVKFGKE
jgi:hypothetical protein